jgi:hypothetical protein
MEIKIIKEKISKEELRKTAQDSFEGMVKAVVDIEKEIIALGGELHADANELLIKQGSSQKDLWGINIYPDESKEDYIEFNSLINIRPSLGNRSIEIQDLDIKEKIREIINKLIK